MTFNDSHLVTCAWSRRSAWRGFALALIMASTATAAIPSTSAQDVPKREGDSPAATPQSPVSTPPSPPSKPESPKSLDDLLGVPRPAEPNGRKSSADDAAEREQAKRLERSLEGASMDDLVKRAVDGMKTAAERLGDAKDPGIGTQRAQEDVIKTLDRLLEEAQKQQKRQPSSSSSRRQGGKPQDQQSDPKENSGQKGSRAEQQGSDSQRGTTSGDEATDGQRPPDQSSADGTELDEARIEWGRLPERVRDLVLQGRRDRVSTIYERLTREYYRRLAEEASK